MVKNRRTTAGAGRRGGRKMERKKKAAPFINAAGNGVYRLSFNCERASESRVRGATNHTCSRRDYLMALIRVVAPSLHLYDVLLTNTKLDYFSLVGRF